MEDFQQLFDQFNDLRIGVVGDIMLDTYIWGEVDRISPEAPVPIVSAIRKEERIGGAGNVALNLQSLGAKAYVISVTGKDAEADCLHRVLETQKIDGSYLLTCSDRITTNKTRIISRNQQMMRLDSEITHDLTNKESRQFISQFRKFVNEVSPHVVILEDYNKGVLTKEIIVSVIALCQSRKIRVAVDPKRRNFFEYKGVDIFKPNLKEVKDALNLLSVPIGESQLADMHERLFQQLQHKISFITLSEKGVFYSDGSDAAIIPSHIRNIADVSGAGDTVIAVAAVVYGATQNVHLMSEIANIAGGLVCEEVGTAIINKKQLQHECELLLS